jgi:peptidyl-dipeptidase A
MKYKLFIIVLVLFSILICSCVQGKKDKAVLQFINDITAKVKPLERERNLASWRASISGKAEDFDLLSKLDLQLRTLYSNPQDFAKIKAFKESGPIADSLLQRQIDILHNNFLVNQIEPQLLEKTVKKSVEIENKFNAFRAEIDGRKVTNNEMLKILKTETDPARREKAWLASKQVGAAVAADIIELVRLRNQAAKTLGFNNYHTMSLAASEQNAEDVAAIFNDLYHLTAEPFTAIKNELDQILSAKYGIRREDMQPWHYHDPFFQETPQIFEQDLDAFYKDKDVIALARQFFSGISLPVDDILAVSDLYEKEGKNPHAFSTDIDRNGDVRILCNAQNNESWMETMLHELGHAAYDKAHNYSAPYLLREPAHPFVTEAVAMFFGRLSRDAGWMQDMLGLSDAERERIAALTQKYARLKQLIFARWAMVMFFFEKELYANPDQDLNALWQRLVAKYQLLTLPQNRNTPDWAAKIHIALYPCYYHNYLLGELLASQWGHYIYSVLLKDGASLANQPQVGRYFREQVFKYGRTLAWNDLISHCTGEPLTSRYFVEQFVSNGGKK